MGEEARPGKRLSTNRLRDDRLDSDVGNRGGGQALADADVSVLVVVEDEISERSADLDSDSRGHE